MKKCKNCNGIVVKGIYCTDCRKFVGFFKSGFFKKLKIFETKSIKESAKKAKILLNKEYHVNEKSIRDIAKEYGISIFSLHNFFRKSEIKRRGLRESITLSKRKVQEFKKKHEINVRSRKEVHIIKNIFKKGTFEGCEIRKKLKIGNFIYKPFLIKEKRVFDVICKQTYKKRKNFFDWLEEGFKRKTNIRFKLIVI